MLKLQFINHSQSKQIGIYSLIKLITLSILSLLLFSCSSEDKVINYDAPRNLTVEKLSNGKVKLSWTYASQSSDVVYIISRKIGAGVWLDYYDETSSDTKEFIDDVPTISYTIYSYKVKAKEVETGNESFESEPASYFSEITQPTELSVNQIGESQIVFSWKDNVIGEAGYMIDKKINNGDWTLSYATLAENSQSYTDEIGQLYQNVSYRVYAFVGNSNSPKNEVSFTPTIQIPDSLRAVQLSQNQIRISWINNSEQINSFGIQRKIGSNDWTELDSVGANVNNYVDNLSLESASLSYRVRSRKGNLYSAFSEPANINMNINQLSFVNLINQGNQVFAKDHYVFVANDYNGALIYDISNPTSPNMIKYIDMPGRTLSVYVNEDRLYMANDLGVLHVYDINDITNPVKLYDDIQFYGQGNDIKIMTINNMRYAVIASGNSGIKIVSFDEQSLPFVKKVINTSASGNVFKILTDQNDFYTAEGINGIRKFNLSNPDNPLLIKHKVNIGTIVDIAMNDYMIYAARGDLGIAVLDRNDFAVISEYDTQGYSNSVAIDARNLYIADRDNGFMMVSIINPYNLYSLYQYSSDDYIISVSVLNKYAFVLSQNQLKIIQIRP